MWSPEAEEPNTIEALVALAGRMPLSTDTFRGRVLAEAFQAQRQSRSSTQIEGAITAGLLAGLLIGLPGYYHSLRQPASPPVVGQVAWKPPADFPTGTDGYEWSLIEAELSARDHSAKALRGSL